MVCCIFVFCPSLSGTRLMVVTFCFPFISTYAVCVCVCVREREREKERESEYIIQSGPKVVYMENNTLINK